MDHEFDQDGVCTNCGLARDAVVICGPDELKYQPAVHVFGARKWEPIGEQLQTVAEAFKVLGETLDANRRVNFPRYNRAGIWAVEQGESYYDPHQVYEVVVRL